MWTLGRSPNPRLFGGIQRVSAGFGHWSAVSAQTRAPSGRRPLLVPLVDLDPLLWPLSLSPRSHPRPSASARASRERVPIGAADLLGSRELSRDSEGGRARSATRPRATPPGRRRAELVRDGLQLRRARTGFGHRTLRKRRPQGRSRPPGWSTPMTSWCRHHRLSRGRQVRQPAQREAVRTPQPRRNALPGQPIRCS